MTPEEVWRSKSDEQVADAAQHLDDYTEVGQQIILSEVERRGLLTNEEVGVDERPEETEPQLDEAELQVALDRMRPQQNLPGAVVAGIASAMVGAVVWAAVTVATDYQIGWMAVGVGFIVGVAVREVGKGVDTSFGMVGAVMSALGCATGNVLAICGLIANQQELGILDVVGQLNATAVIALMIATFSPMDLLFYGIAVYEGYRFSFRRISQEDLADTLEDRGVSTRPMMPNRLSIAVIVALAIAAWSVLTRPPEIHQIPDGAQLRFALTGWDLVESSESRKVWMNSDGDELSMDRVEGSSALAPFDDLDGVRSRSRDLARAAGGGILSADVLDLGRMTAVTLIHKREELRGTASLRVHRPDHRPSRERALCHHNNLY